MRDTHSFFVVTAQLRARNLDHLGGTDADLMRAFIDRWWFGREPILGMDIRDDGVTCARVDRYGGARYVDIETSSAELLAGEFFHDPSRYAAVLRELTEERKPTVRRCAVALPVSASFVSWVSLPPHLGALSDTVLCHAALERAFLRPQDVKARIHHAISLPNGGSTVLLIAAKLPLVGALEEVCRSVALDLSYLLPRPFVLHYAASLWGGRVGNGQVAYVDPSSTGPILYLFNEDTYCGTLNELPETVDELRGKFISGDSDDQSDEPTAVLSLVVNGPQALYTMISERYSSSCVQLLGSLPVARHLPARNSQLVAHALSQWEEAAA